MLNYVRSFWADESGVAATEYALLLAVIASGLTVAAVEFGQDINGAIQGVADCVNDPATCEVAVIP